MTEQRVVRYIRTANLPRVIPCFNNKQILSVKARRSKTLDKNEIYDGLDYIEGIMTTNASFEIDFNSRKHGKFDAEKVLKAFDRTGIEHLTIQSMDIAIPDHNEITHAIKKETDNGALARKSFVAHFEKWPTSRELQDNPYREDVKNFMTPKEKSAHLHPTSLDLKYIIPTRIWAEIILRHKISNEYKYAIKQWKEFTDRNDEHAGIIRKVMENIFPKDKDVWNELDITPRDMWETKNLRQKGVNEWIVVSIGNGKKEGES